MTRAAYLPLASLPNLRQLALALALSWGCAGVATAQAAPEATQNYTVEAGDTLQAIAQKLF